MNREIYLSSSPEDCSRISRAELRKRWEKGAPRRLAMDTSSNMLSVAHDAHDRGHLEESAEEAEVALMLYPYCAPGGWSDDEDNPFDVEQ